MNIHERFFQGIVMRHRAKKALEFMDMPDDTPNAFYNALNALDGMAPLKARKKTLNPSIGNAQNQDFDDSKNK